MVSWGGYGAENGKPRQVMGPDAAFQSSKDWEMPDSRIETNFGNSKKLGCETRRIEFSGEEVMRILVEYMSKHYGVPGQPNEVQLDLTQGFPADAGGPGIVSRINKIIMEYTR